MSVCLSTGVWRAYVLPKEEAVAEAEEALLLPLAAGFAGVQEQIPKMNVHGAVELNEIDSLEMPEGKETGGEAEVWISQVQLHI